MIDLPKKKEKQSLIKKATSKEVWIIGIILAFAILILIRGTPDYFSLGPFGWNVDRQAPADGLPPQENGSERVYLHQALEVVDLKTRQTIYLKGEKAFADFKIKKNLDFDYVIDIRWISPSGETQALRHDENMFDTYEAWHAPLDELGDWQVQVVVGWQGSMSQGGAQYSMDEITSFRVINP